MKRNAATCLVLLQIGAASAGAAETRFSIDPNVDFNALRAAADPTNMPANVTHVSGSPFLLDASAILHNCDMAKLYAAAYDFNHYVSWGMPNLKQSVVVEGHAPTDGTIFVWSDLEAFTKESQSYMEVDVAPTLPFTYTRGISWEGIPGRPGRPGWTYPDAPVFKDFYGSWYMQDLGAGDVYVRYFLAAAPATSVPDFILNVLVPNQLKSDARKTVQVLWQQAKTAGH